MEPVLYSSSKWSKGAKPFRISKNKKKISFFNKFEGIEEIETSIPKTGFIPPEANSNNVNNIIINEEEEQRERNRDEILEEMEEK